MSQITTHILDTSRGKPAAGMHLTLSQQTDNKWRELASGTSDQDGRVSDLLDANVILPAGEYKLTFNSGDYYRALNTPCFHPQIEIQFHVADSEHYHVPLLLSPFGYSTYRGS